MMNDITPKLAGTGPYACMRNPVVSQGRLSLRAVEPQHVDAIRQWRNSQTEVLRQQYPIRPAQQMEYFARHVWPEKELPHPSKLLLIYHQDEQPIGYGGLVHIAWEHKRAEVSFLLAPDRERDLAERAGLFAAYLQLIRQVAFNDLGLCRLFTETYANRKRHIQTLEASGFLLEGRLRSHVMIDGIATDSVFHGLLASPDRNVPE